MFRVRKRRLGTISTRLVIGAIDIFILDLDIRNSYIRLIILNIKLV